MKKLTKKEIAARDNKIQALYGQSCQDIQIGMFDIPKVFKVAVAAIEAGDNDETVKTKIRAFVDTIRKN